MGRKSVVGVEISLACALGGECARLSFLRIDRSGFVLSHAGTQKTTHKKHAHLPRHAHLFWLGTPERSLVCDLLPWKHHHCEQQMQLE